MTFIGLMLIFGALLLIGAGLEDILKELKKLNE